MVALDVGVVGLGKMGILHAAIFNRVPGTRLIALADCDSRLRSIASMVLPKVHAYRDHCELVESESPDILVVATPTYLHASVIRDAMKSEASLFCEKPLATNYAEAGALVDLTKGRKTMAGFQKRFVPTFRLARRMIKADAPLGRISRIRSTAFLSDVLRPTSSWRSDRTKGGGALAEWGVHLVDLLLWFFGDIRIRAAFQRHPYTQQADDYTHAVFETPGGALGTMDVSWSHRGSRLPQIVLEVEGTRGSLLVTDDKILLDLDRPHGDLRPGTTAIYRAQLEEPVDFMLGFPEFHSEARAFVNAIVSGSESPIPFSAAAEVHRVVDEIYRHARGR